MCPRRATASGRFLLAAFLIRSNAILQFSGITLRLEAEALISSEPTKPATASE